MQQSMRGLNVSAVVQVVSTLIQKPQLLIPHISVQNINEIDFRQLKEMGFKGIVFDKDNTLTYPHQNRIVDEVKDALETCTRVFERQNLVLFSNSAGSNDDPSFQQAHDVETQLNLSVLRHNTKKPNGATHLKTHFGSSVALSDLIMIGDRYSTDVLFGNMNGMLTIRTKQLCKKHEHVVNRLMQQIETQMIRCLEISKIQAPIHKRYHV